MSYFSKFPNLIYDLTKPGDLTNRFVIAKDIVRRVKLRENIQNNVFAYDEYDIQEGERPDIVAHSFYNDSDLAWIILVTNEIHDVYEDWPRTERELRKYIDDKYTGLGPYAVKGTDISTGKSYSGVNGYYYPLFSTAEEARNYDRQQGFSGASHTHNFSEFPSKVFHMPSGANRYHAKSDYDKTLYTLWTANSGTNGIHHYERPQASGDANVMVRTTEPTYTIVTNIGVTETKNSIAITNQLYEERLNETKRRIRILRPALVSSFVEEFEDMIGD